MREIALHILDIAQNSVRARADLIRVRLAVDSSADVLEVEVADNGCGMDPEMAATATDPFVTSRTTRRIGLGLSLLQAGAEATGGSFSLMAQEGIGTRVRASYVLSNIDRPPIGDFAGTLHSLMICNPELDFVVSVRLPGMTADRVLDTREMRALMEDLRLDEPEVAAWLSESLGELFPAAYAEF